MTRETAKEIGLVPKEVETAMETVRLYLKQELADCHYITGKGIDTSRAYEDQVSKTLNFISDFRWDEDI